MAANHKNHDTNYAFPLPCRLSMLHPQCCVLSSLNAAKKFDTLVTCRSPIGQLRQTPRAHEHGTIPEPSTRLSAHPTLTPSLVYLKLTFCTMMTGGGIFPQGGK